MKLKQGVSGFPEGKVRNSFIQKIFFFEKTIANDTGFNTPVSSLLTYKKPRTTNNAFTMLGAAIALCLTPSLSQAAGFAIAEQSVKGLGNAFSGGAASADDASTVWYNPAGLTQFSGTLMNAGLHGIFPSGEYSDQGSILNPALTGGSPVPLSGRAEAREKDAAVPNFYVSHAISDRLVLGLGMNAPFGLVTDYDSDWVGRYHALRSDLATVNINPAMGFKVTPTLSVGVGVSAQYIDVKLSKAIDMSAACLSAQSLATCAGAGLTTPGSLSTDSQVRLEGDDWSFGFNVGVLYEPMQGTRFGLHYRSKVKHDLTGMADFTHTHPGATVLAGMAGLTDQAIEASVELPETVSVSAFHQINTRWSIQGDISWVKWSRFDELRIDFASGRSDITPEAWDNSLRYSIGGNYYHNEKLTIRAGLAIEETPITGPDLRTPRIADADRVWLAMGASYAMNQALSFDISYTHIFVDDPAIDYVSDFPSTPHATASSLLRGEYDASVDILSMQLNYQF